MNTNLFICSIIIGIWYLIISRKVELNYFQCKSFINIQFVLKVRKITWIIWLLFILISTLFTTAVKFGSNIWFSRHISISGPYQFAVVAIGYLLPFISIAIPLILNVAPKLILKYEVGEENENKE